jgi:hypothetical protein
MLEISFFIEAKLGVKVKDEEMIPDNLDSVNKIAQFERGARRPDGRCLSQSSTHWTRQSAAAGRTRLL